MSEVVRLPLKTSDGFPLVHKFYRQEREPHGLLVTFPGDKYGVDGPLLYYLSEMMWASGWDTLAVTYGFQLTMEPFSTEVIPGLLQECRSAVEEVLAQRAYPRIGLAGKSLGAGVVAYLCQSEPSLAESRTIFFTPALGTPLFDPLLVEIHHPSYIAIGTQDRFYDQEILDTLRASRHFELTVIEGADHSMDVFGDLEASVNAVKKIVAEVVDFIQKD
jgi:predicted alpha/beta-hydrolase family hydrolase